MRLSPTAALAAVAALAFTVSACERDEPEVVGEPAVAPAVVDPEPVPVPVPVPVAADTVIVDTAGTM